LGQTFCNPIELPNGETLITATKHERTRTLRDAALYITRPARITIGDGGNWREIDHRSQKMFHFSARVSR
jgi:hypothetical protein